MQDTKSISDLRKTGPPIHQPTIPTLLPVERWTLGNGLPVVAMGGIEAPVLRVEMIWNAGRPFEPQRLLAGATNDLMAEGTRHRSAAGLERFFEQFGTRLVMPDLMDTGNLALSTIHRRMGEVLPVMAEVIAEPAFDEENFTRFLRRRKQRLREGMSDNDTLAYRLITEAVFGSDNPYGYNGYPDGYDTLRLEDIRAYYQQRFHAGNGTLMVIGNINEQVNRTLEATFGQLPAGPAAKASAPVFQSSQPGIIQLKRPRAQQSMIRRGRRGVHIQHPDYPGLIVLDTIFGGYFGSRLMKNIREEKGYTYGIESDLDTYRLDGSFNVSADVANENLGNVRREIDLEAKKLRQDLIPEAELNMVRAYLGGSISMELDGPFGHAFRYRSAIIKDYEPVRFLARLDDAIHHISASELRDLAQRYLSPGDDWEVIVGGGPEIAGARLLTAEEISRPLGNCLT